MAEDNAAAAGAAATEGAGGDKGAGAPNAGHTASMLGGGEGEGAANGQTNGVAHAEGGEGDEGAQPNGQANGNGAADPWWKRFGEGLDKSEAMTWRNFASRYNGEPEFAKSFIELRKSAVFLPKDDDKDKDTKLDQIFDRLGRPKDAKEYKFTWGKDVPQLDDAESQAQESFRMVAHRNRLTQPQIDALVGWQGEVRKAQFDAFDAGAKATTDRNLKALKTQWGQDFERNKSVYNQALKHYAGKDGYDEISRMRLQDGSFLGDHPAFAGMMVRIGSERAEDDRDPTAFNASVRETAQQQISRIEHELLAKGLNPTSPEWARHPELDRLYKQAHGSRPMGPQPFGTR